MPGWAGVLGAGPMGCWLARHLKRLGYQVILFDLKRDLARREAGKIGCLWARSINQFSYDVKVVFVAVGSGNAAATILKMGEILPPSSNVIDISSVKTAVVEGLKNLDRDDMVITLSHPLFGPGASSLRGKYVVFTPFRNHVRERRVLARFFKGAKVIKMGYQDHDKLMAHCMSVPRLATMAIIEGWTAMRSLDLTTSQKALTLAASTMLMDSPRLFTEIVGLNPYTGEAVEEFLNKIQELKSLDGVELERRLRRLVIRIPGMEERYRKTYQLLDG